MKPPTSSRSGPSRPYRLPFEPAPDEEVLALAQLVARAQRARRLIAAPILLAGSGLGGLVYVLLRHGLFEGIDCRAPYLTALVTVLPLFVLSQALAAYVARKAVVARSPVWIAELTKPGVSAMLLEAFVRSL